ncbi:MAG: 50S ribosomal protein L15 [bacterium]|nr:50S ribosomal protein L15 [bacterium]
MIKLHQLKKHPKSTKRRKVVGRGLGSGHGTYSTRGGKGQTARSGHSKMPARFEGGRQPLIRQLPKNRGFKSLQEKAVVLKMEQLNAFNDGDIVTMTSLKAKNVIPMDVSRVKVLQGKLNRKLTFRVPVSKTAKTAIEAAGGSVK